MDIEKVKGELDSLTKSLNEKIEKANEEAKNAADESVKKVDVALKEEIKNMVSKHEELKGLYEKQVEEQQKQLDEISTKIKTGAYGRDEEVTYEKAIKAHLEKSKEEGLFDKFAEKGANSGRALNLEIKAAVDMLVSNAPASGTIVPLRKPGIIVPMTNDMLVRSLMNVTTTDVPIISYLKELAVEGAPTGVAEGALKPKVSFTTELVQSTAKKIAANSKMSEELMTDVPGFTGYITGRLTDLLMSEENRQILYGATATELTGITGEASAFTDPGYDVVSPQNWDVLAATNALLTATAWKLWATGHVINPAQFFEMASYKDADGKYLAPIIFTNGVPTIFGQPLIATAEMAAGNFLSGNFRRGAEIYQRAGISVRVYDQNEDDAVKNMVTVVIEERLIMPIYIPGAFIYDAFADGITELTAPAV